MALKSVNILTSLMALVFFPLSFAGLVLIHDHFYWFYLLAASLVGFWLLGGSVRSLFRPLRADDVWIIFFSILAAAVIGMLLALIGTYMLGITENLNPPFDKPVTWSFAIKEAFPLFGEELFAVLVLTVLEHYLPKKKSSILWSALLGCLIFSLYHLAAEGWHIWGYALVFPFVRLPFTYAWYRSNRNLWVNGLAHWGYHMLVLMFAADILIYF